MFFFPEHDPGFEVAKHELLGMVCLSVERLVSDSRCVNLNASSRANAVWCPSHHLGPPNLSCKENTTQKKGAVTSTTTIHPIQNILRFTLLIENDLILAPDFLWYFRLAGSLLDRDASLWCISSWNDNGFRDIVSDEKKLFRTDYFPGLGWMIRS